MKKIILMMGSFLLANSVFAATQEIKLLNADAQDKIMQISYQICSGKVNCTPENTIQVTGHSFSSISSAEDQFLLITKVVEIENGKEIASTGNQNGICSAWFGIDPILKFNSYGTKQIFCSDDYGK